jgi:putative transposase
MSQSLAKIWIHTTFSTKERRPTISPAIESRLYAYMSGIFGKLDSHAMLIGGMPDHIHALFRLSKNKSLVEVI